MLSCQSFHVYQFIGFIGITGDCVGKDNLLLTSIVRCVTSQFKVSLPDEDQNIDLNIVPFIIKYAPCHFLFCSWFSITHLKGRRSELFRHYLPCLFQVFSCGLCLMTFLAMFPSFHSFFLKVKKEIYLYNPCSLKS